MSNKVLLMSAILLIPISIVCFFIGSVEVEKAKKPRVVILHVHKEEIPFLKVDEDDWKEIHAEEVT